MVKKIIIIFFAFYFVIKIKMTLKSKAHFLIFIKYSQKKRKKHLLIK
jgi:hypothetical protein